MSLQNSKTGPQWPRPCGIHSPLHAVQAVNLTRCVSGDSVTLYGKRVGLT